MDTVQMIMLGFPALLTIAKIAILAVAVVFAVQGILQPYGRRADNGLLANARVQARAAR